MKSLSPLQFTETSPQKINFTQRSCSVDLNTDKSHQTLATTTKVSKLPPIRLILSTESLQPSFSVPISSTKNHHFIEEEHAVQNNSNDTAQPKNCVSKCNKAKSSMTVRQNKVQEHRKSQEIRNDYSLNSLSNDEVKKVRMKTNREMIKKQDKNQANVDQIRIALKECKNHHKKKKNEFVTYIETYNKNKSIITGPMFGAERSNQRNLATKESLLTLKQTNLQKILQKLNDTPVLQKQRRKQLSPLLERLQIRKQRQSLFSSRQQQSMAKQRNKTFQLMTTQNDKTYLKHSINTLKKQYKKSCKTMSFSMLASTMAPKIDQTYQEKFKELASLSLNLKTIR